jgi:hypothetical protein
VPTLATSVSREPINVIGFGSCGGSIVCLLAGERRSVIDGDYVAADGPGADPGTAPFEVLSKTSDHHEDRPLVVVTDVSSRSCGEHAWGDRVK